ncbi:hypothetical protein [Bacillus cereus group sp. RP32]|uniref:hypothetical protein n=1 Tax=Bacillus cereus group sp. RP32 TaxID=3040258 RepID=UPI003395516C
MSLPYMETYIEKLEKELDAYTTALYAETKVLAQKFKRDTDGENELQVVLRGHLYLENAVERLLQSVLVKPGSILTNRFMFISKVQLGIALGVIPESRKTLYEKLNTLRNNYAHQLNFKMTDKHLNDIVSCMDKDLKSSYPGSSQNNLLENMKLAILTVWADALANVYKNETQVYVKEVREINKLMKFKISPLSDEELSIKGDEVIAKMKRRINK